MEPEKESEKPQTYALRFSPRALADIEAAFERLLFLTGVAAAIAWKDGLFDAAATLATNPRRLAVAPESRFFTRRFSSGDGVRQLLYRRTPASPFYRLFFVATDDTDDGPTVILLHLRHGARRPLTRSEAQEIEREEK